MKTNQADQIAALVKKHGKMVFATVYRILGNADDAEDAMQDLFLDILGKWNKSLKPDSIRDWGAYLRVAASRSAVNLIRRSRKKHYCNVEYLEDLEDTSQSNPRNLAIKHQKAMLMRKALHSLPEREARVFALRYFEDLSYDEIAEYTKLKINFIGVLLHRARGHLKEILDPEMSHKSQNNVKAGNDLKKKEKYHVAE
jgi:RNA polymerase sigma-70 factor, ECF subfamily